MLSRSDLRRVDHGDGAFLAKGRVGQHQVEARAGVRGQAVAHGDGAFFPADGVQVEVHGAQPGGAVDDLPAAEGVKAQEALLVAVEPVGVGDIFVRGQEEAARAAGRVTDGLHGSRAGDLHHGADQLARGEVLARAAFHVFGVLLQQALVDGPLHVHAQAGPGFFVDELDQAAQLGRVLDLILRFAEDQPQQALFLAQRIQRVAVLDLQRVAVHGQQGGPVQPGGDDGGLVERRAGLLVGHLEEQQEGELLDVIAVGYAVIAQHVAVIPQAGNNGGFSGGHLDFLSGFS
jgi:hypothetical protein